MDKTPKAWWTSKGVWGGILAAAAPIVGIAAHVTISGADINALASNFATIGSSITAIVGAVGGIMAVYGRVTAKSRIG